MYQSTTLIGNLGSDVEMRYTQTGVPVSSFSLAVNRSWTNQDGQKVDKTTWFRVTCWRKLAEVTSEYLTKGRQVMVTGEVEEPSVWTDRDDNQRASLEITAQVVKFLGSPNGNNGNGASYQDNGAERPPVNERGPVPAQAPVGTPTPNAVPVTAPVGTPAPAAAVNPIDTPAAVALSEQDIPF